MLLLARCLALVVRNDDIIIESLVHNGLYALPAIDTLVRVLVVAVGGVAHDDHRVVEAIASPIASAYPLAGSTCRRRFLAIRHHDNRLVQSVAAFLWLISIDSGEL